MLLMPSSSKASFPFLLLISVLTFGFFASSGKSDGAELEAISLTAEPAANSQFVEEIDLILSEQDSIVFSVKPSQPQITTVETDSGLFNQIHIPGYNQSGIAGQPSLPTRSYLVALPPGTIPELEILEVENHQIDGMPVLPVVHQKLLNGAPESANNLDEFIPDYDENYQPDDEIYHTDNFFPAAPVQLGDVFWLRDSRVVRVHIYPVLANPYRRQLKSFTDLKIQVTFKAEPNSTYFTRETREEGDTFDSIQRQSILNYGASRDWRIHRQFDSSPKISPCMMDSNAYRIATGETGIYKITYAGLNSSGWPAGILIDDMRMCFQDSEIAIRIDDDGDDVFDGSDSLFFYGQAIKTQETTTNVYWLSHTDGNPGKRMDAREDSLGGQTPAVYTTTYHLETDANYHSFIPSDDSNDHWYWRASLFGQSGAPNSSNSLTTEFNLNNIAGDTHDVPVTVQVWGWDNSEHNAYPWHKMEILVNDVSLGTHDFYGRGAPYLYKAIASSTDLEEGINTITVRAREHSGNFHQILVDWIEITPQRQFVAESNYLAFDVTAGGIEDMSFASSGFTPASAVVDIYDVTDPANTTWQQKTASSGSISFNRLISGTQAFEIAANAAVLTPLSITADSIPSMLLSGENNRADMIIITDPVMNGALAPLKTLRSNQGLDVMTVNVQDIFDEFNYGTYSTEAIKEFLSYAYQNWAGDREYVLLGGEGSYDHRDILGLNGPGGNLVPVYLRSGIDSGLGEAAADNQYVDFDGDDLADMLLGRLPARDPAEMAVMVDKIIDYETGPTTAPWRATQLFVTDNGKVPVSGQECQVDSAGDFFETVDDFLAIFFPDNHFLRRISYAPPTCYPSSEVYYAESVLEMQTSIVQQLNDGKQFVVYTGHSSTVQWGHENYLDVQLAGSLSNGTRTPIMLPMTCLVGMYHRPQGDTLSETILKLDSGGSVASYAPTGFQVQHGHSYLLEGFYDGVFSDGDRILGQAVFKAKLNLDSAFSFQDLHDTFMLLGDPAMRMDMPEILVQGYLPITSK